MFAKCNFGYDHLYSIFCSLLSSCKTISYVVSNTVFGVRNHEISLQLLQYGDMAINSRHR